jgi:hypothetical protein
LTSKKRISQGSCFGPAWARESREAKYQPARPQTKKNSSFEEINVLRRVGGFPELDILYAGLQKNAQQSDKKN